MEDNHDPRNDRELPHADCVNSSDIQETIGKLKGKDRVGTFGQVVSTAGGAGAGAAAAGTIAGAAGASTLLGSTSLGSLLGGVFVTATPIGWVAGCALAGAAVAYGLSKAIHSGGRNDRIREETVKRLTARLKSLQNRRQDLSVPLAQLKINIGNAIRDEHISNEQAARLVTAVENGNLDTSVALARIKAFYA
jgi:hypothetical protein